MITGMIAAYLLGAFALFMVVWLISGYSKSGKWLRFYAVVKDYIDGVGARALYWSDWEEAKRKWQKKEGRKFGKDGKPLDDIGWR